MSDADLGLTPLDPTPQLRYRVKDALIELIISRQLPPGAHLREADLAMRLQVSRHPVREAFQALHHEGWVELRPGRGAFVHDPTEREVDEVFAMRVILEQESAVLAARHATSEEVDALRKICEQGRRAAMAQDVDTVVERNATLHRQICEMSRNRVLAGFVAVLDKRVRWYFTKIAVARGTDSWDEHDQLVDAIAAHDSRRAKSVMQAHVTRSQRTYHQQLSQDSE